MVEQFCKSILQIVGRNTKALANLIMGLASQSFARSVVEVSLSKCYHYQYSSINKVIAGLSKVSSGEKVKVKETLSRLEVEKKFALKGGLFSQAI